MSSHPQQPSGWTLETLKEFFEARLADADRALQLQGVEYERRLTALNHEHARAVEVQNTYVTEEKFDSFVQRFEEYKTTTTTALNLAAGRSSGLNAGLVYLFSSVAALGTVISALILVFAH